MPDDPTDSSPLIEITIEDPQWLVCLPQADAVVRRAVASALSGEALAGKIRSSAEVSVVLASDERVRELNGLYRAQDKATNVLSFPACDGPDDPSEPGLPLADESPYPQLLGDVILARQTVCREADEQDKALSDHLSHLVVHGVLHLFGYDHQSDGEAEVMEGLEMIILQDLGIGNPYVS